MDSDEENKCLTNIKIAYEQKKIAKDVDIEIDKMFKKKKKRGLTQE